MTQEDTEPHQNRRPSIASVQDIRGLEARHRAAMLDLVLAWASLDGALSRLLTQMAKKPLEKGPEWVGRKNAYKKFDAMIKLAQPEPWGNRAVQWLTNIKLEYERYVISRNSIAHAHCLGISINDPDYIVFAEFENEGDGFAIDAVPIQQIELSTKFGRLLLDKSLRIGDWIAKGNPNDESLRADG